VHPSPLVELPAGTFVMGEHSRWAYPGDGEGPLHEVEVDRFAIDPVAVTNNSFANFVDATGHVSDAERYGWSFVFGGLLPDDFPETRAVVGAEWWRQVFSADWRHPNGPQSTIEDCMNHPVVHVSWADAQSYCAWSGTRLPTEAEWEYAARGGTRGPFPWGDELEPNGEHRMNVFQGSFPDSNECADGYYATAPVDAFPPNAFGLYNVTGNVWEWCDDWFGLDAYALFEQWREPARIGIRPATGCCTVTVTPSSSCCTSPMDLRSARVEEYSEAGTLSVAVSELPAGWPSMRKREAYPRWRSRISSREDRAWTKSLVITPRSAEKAMRGSVRESADILNCMADLSTDSASIRPALLGSASAFPTFVATKGSRDSTSTGGVIIRVRACLLG
jgi:formylglycine-generating enzyme required for sulfatase activity